MAEYIKVTLEHHLNKRYHAIKHGPGRRPALTFGKFNLRYREPKSGGKRVRVTLAVSDLNAALEARRKKEIELHATAGAQRESKHNLPRVAHEFLAEIQATRKRKTHSAYRTALTYFIKVVGDKSLDQITRQHMLDFRVYLREEMKQQPRSEWNKFSNVMGFLRKYGVTNLGITKHDWPRYVEEEPEIYERGWLEKFFAACTSNERVIYQFFLMTGFREQEVMYFTSRCIDFENATVTVRHKPEFGWTPKMYKERTVPIPQSLLEKLKQTILAPDQDNLLFPTGEGRPQYHFLEMSKGIARRAGLPEDLVWLHKFRATFCTQCLCSGIDLPTVQMWMGHTDLASTMRYLKPQRGKQVRDKVEAIWTQTKLLNFVVTCLRLRLGAPAT